MEVSIKSVRDPTAEQRLFDYFLVIEPNKESLSNFIHSKVPPGERHELKSIISTVYPDKLWIDYELPGSLILKNCFPRGIFAQQQHEMSRFYNFVIADASLPVYVSCLTFYEHMDIVAVHSHSKMKYSNRRWSSNTYTAIMSKDWFIPKSLCIVSHHPLQGVFMSFLTTLYELSFTVGGDQLSAIVKKFSDSVPLPPQGLVEILFQMAQDKPSIRIFRGPLDYPLYPDVSIWRMFSTLSVENIVEAFLSLMVEQTLVIQSSSYSFITEITENLLSFMFPFRWVSPYLTALPQDMSDYLSLPTPAVFGLHSSVILPVGEMEDCVIWNVDDDSIIIHRRTPIPRPRAILKDSRYRALCRSLSEAIQGRTLGITRAQISDHVMSRLQQENMWGPRYYQHPSKSRDHRSLCYEIRNIFLRFHAQFWEDYMNYARGGDENRSSWARIDQDSFLFDLPDGDRDYAYFVFTSQHFQIFEKNFVESTNNPDKTFFDNIIASEKKKSWKFGNTKKVSELPQFDYLRSDQIVVDNIANPRSKDANFPRLKLSASPNEYSVYEVKRNAEAIHQNSTLEKKIMPVAPHGLLDALKSKFETKLLGRPFNEEKCRMIMVAQIKGKQFRSGLQQFDRLVVNAGNDKVSEGLIHLAAICVNCVYSSPDGLLLLDAFRNSGRLGDTAVCFLKITGSMGGLLDSYSCRDTDLYSSAHLFPDAISSYTTFSFATGRPILFEKLLPRTSIRRESLCRKCKVDLTLREFVQGWSSSPEIIATQCPRCHLSFNSKLYVSSSIEEVFVKPPQNQDEIKLADLNLQEDEEPTLCHPVVDEPAPFSSTDEGKVVARPSRSISSNRANRSAADRFSSTFAPLHEQPQPLNPRQSHSADVSAVYGKFPRLGTLAETVSSDSPIVSTESSKERSHQLFPFPALLRVVDRLNKSHIRRGSPSIESFIESNYTIFWNLVFYSTWMQIPLDVFMPLVPWEDLVSLVDR